MIEHPESMSDRRIERDRWSFATHALFPCGAVILSIIGSAMLPACAPRDAQVTTVARPVNTGATELPPGQSATVCTTDGSVMMAEVPPAADSWQLLKDAFRAASAIESARMTFHRQERLGLFKSLQPVERMKALCREVPFSVLFTWLDDNSEFTQCLFIEGANDGAVLLNRRKGLFGGPGGVVAFPPELGVVFQKAKLPITDFGLRRVMAAIKARIDAADALGGVNVRSAGRAIVGPADEMCDHLTLLFPDGDAHAAKRVELYLHVDTHLPVMIELWLPDRGGDTDSSLDARYIFARTEVNPMLTNEDFRLDSDESGDTGIGAVATP